MGRDYTMKRKMGEWKKIADKFKAISVCHNHDFSMIKT